MIQNRDSWGGGPVNTEMNIRVPKNVGKYLTI